MWKFNIHIDRGLNTVMENGRYAAVVQDPTIISRGLRGNLPPFLSRCDNDDDDDDSIRTATTDRGRPRNQTVLIANTKCPNYLRLGEY